MTPRARARLLTIVLVLFGLGLATALALYGLSGKITYFHTPSEITAGTLTDKQLAHSMRIGGMVKDKSLQQQGDTYTFIVFDNTDELNVTYRGILPDLFREGQSVIAYGHYNAQDKIFNADQILAKHDENYMPPEVKRAMDKNHDH